MTDDIHRIRRMLRQLDEARPPPSASEEEAASQEVNRLIWETREEFDLFMHYMHQIHFQSEAFQTKSTAKILIQFLVDRRAQFLTRMRQMQDQMEEWETVPGANMVDDAEPAIAELLRMIKDLKALCFIVADIDNNYKLNANASDTETKVQMHKNRWAHAAIQNLRKQGVNFPMAS